MQDWIILAIVATSVVVLAVNAHLNYRATKNLENELQDVRDGIGMMASGGRLCERRLDKLEKRIQDARLQKDTIAALQQKVESLTDSMTEITDQFSTLLEQVAKR